MNVLAILVCVLVKESLCVVSMLGRLCTSNKMCYTWHGNEVCGEEGYCVCNHKDDLRYHQNLKPICDTTTEKKNVTGCNDRDCPLGAICNTNNKCVCRDEYVFYNDKCVRGQVSKLLESCGKDGQGLIRYCDFNDKLICTNGKCQCFRGYYINYTSDECEPRLQYIKTYNLTEYRVKPELYCQEEEDCIEGLVCENFKCACPKECEYKREDEACDCGRKPSLVGPIVTGCLSGLIIIFFWAKIFEKTLPKLKKWRDSCSTVSEEGEDVPMSNYPGSSPENQIDKQTNIPHPINNPNPTTNPETQPNTPFLDSSPPPYPVSNMSNTGFIPDTNPPYPISNPNPTSSPETRSNPPLLNSPSPLTYPVSNTSNTGFIQHPYTPY